MAHVSTPASVVHSLAGRLSAERASAARRGPVRSADGVLDYVPRTIFPSNHLWTAFRLRRMLRRTGFERVHLVLIDQPLMEHRILSDAVCVFRPTDIFENGNIACRAHRTIGYSDAVVGTSRGVIDSLTIPENVPTMVLPNGVEFAHFSGAETMPNERRSGFVYVGAVDERFDPAAIMTLAHAMPDETIDIYGPISEDPLPERAVTNVRFHGAIDYDHVPSILAQARVGLLPFKQRQLNAARSPMKLYEYLAAGLYVLSSSVDHHSASLPGVFEYSSDEQMVVSAKNALSSSTLNSEGIAAASRQGWNTKAQELLAFAAKVAPLGDRALRL